MNRRKIRWGAAFGGMLLAEVAQIAAAIGWVAFYSYVVHPGETPDFYRAYAQESGPWVSLIAGTPIFYLVCRWIGSLAPSEGPAPSEGRVSSRAPSQVPTAMALFGLFVVVDLALVLAAGVPSPRIVAFVVSSYLLKLLACHLGGRRAAPKEVAEPV